MPIRHTDKGWWWGSKGPFETEAKAKEVRRAAYASGYRGSETHKGLAKRERSVR
jgi:hypothetical protein